jgi:hypothetical protein
MAGWARSRLSILPRTIRLDLDAKMATGHLTQVLAPAQRALIRLLVLRLTLATR